MKVKNEYVQINLGNKTFTKKNMLLDVYLKRVFKSQIQPVHDTSLINSCYLKLDTPIENVEYDSELNSSDFDIKFSFDIENKNNFINISILDKNYIKLKYKFDNKNGFEYKGISYKQNEFEKFSNRKITAIGFGYEDNGSSQNEIFSFVDTSNMNIVINREEKISIVRVDRFESDGICKGYDFPLHLANDTIVWQNEEKGQLYSVGFGNTMGEMEQEELISNATISTGDTYILLELARMKITGKYPSQNLNLGFMPTIDNSRYLIFKYRLYTIDRYNNVTYLDKYYTMNMPCDKFGLLRVKLKMERS